MFEGMPCFISSVRKSGRGRLRLKSRQHHLDLQVCQVVSLRAFSEGLPKVSLDLVICAMTSVVITQCDNRVVFIDGESVYCFAFDGVVAGCLVFVGEG